MRTILLATDFSNAAQNACTYGLNLAKAFDAELILLHAYQELPVPIGETAITLDPVSIRKDADAQLQNALSSLNTTHQLNITALLREGTPADTIVRVAQELKADLVLTGMKQSGKGLKKIFGSTVTALARKSPIPLVVIPEDASFSPMHSIAIATDEDVSPDTDPFLLDTLRELAERYHAKVYLVRVAKDKFHEGFELLNRPFRLSKMLRTVDPGYECIEGSDIIEGLIDFVRRYNISMLAMLPHKSSVLEQWFTGSTTRAMIFESEIPLLVLPERKKQGTTSREVKREILL